VKERGRQTRGKEGDKRGGFIHKFSVLSFFPNDLLLPKSQAGCVAKIPLILDIRSAYWVIKETQI
jgi:hypothetical protein